MKKYIYFIIPVLIIAIMFSIKFVFLNKEADKSSNSTVDSIDISIDIDDIDSIDWSLYEDEYYTLTKSITLTESKVYNLTGTIDDGVITINTNGNVKLVLADVNITNSSGPCIFVKNANEVVIEIKEGTTNYLEDGTTYNNYEEDEIGTIFSHDDIIFTGTGTLYVKSNNEDAIVSKDDLIIESGTYIITSNDDGIRGKDSVYIKNGNFTITSNSDGIKSTNETDTDKGYILIENGTFNITSLNDGIDSKNKILIKNGIFNITTNADSSSNLSYNNIDTDSMKGIKSTDNLIIENGEFILNTIDDAIHCNNYIGIKSGTFTINSQDDAIHADTELIIDDIDISINNSYEGLETAKITINGGNIKVVSEDDGINVAGGNDSSSLNRPGANNYTSNIDNVLTINGGNIYVDASGDGIDVNGSAYINGGYVYVEGPTNNGNGALDYDRVFEVNGGTLIAGGSSGMLQGVSSTSSLYNVSIVFNSNYGSGDVVIIKDSSNNNIITYESDKTYSSLIVASSSLKKGSTYSIYINDTLYETFTISNITTTIGNMYGNMHGSMNNMDKRGNRR